jgi:hypothetical protein
MERLKVAIESNPQFSVEIFYEKGYVIHMYKHSHCGEMRHMAKSYYGSGRGSSLDKACEDLMSHHIYDVW